MGKEAEIFFGDDPVHGRLDRFVQVTALGKRQVAELGRIRRLAEYDRAEDSFHRVGRDVADREDVAASSNLAHRKLELVLVRAIMVQMVTQVAYCCIVAELNEVGLPLSRMDY